LNIESRCELFATTFRYEIYSEAAQEATDALHQAPDANSTGVSVRIEESHLEEV
jgi:hypothetical protein